MKRLMVILALAGCTPAADLSDCRGQVDASGRLVRANVCIVNGKPQHYARQPKPTLRCDPQGSGYDCQPM